MTTIYATLSPYELRARHALLRWLVQTIEMLLHGRTVMHSLLVLHLGWEGVRLGLPDDAFLLDPKQYAWFMARGPEWEWASIFAAGSAIGFAALIVGHMPVRLFRAWPQAWRAFGAFAMGTCEVVFDHGLTASGAAPTALPTYSVLTSMAFVLMLTHWFPDDRPPDRRG